jgi:uncharacterized lipoprotein YddW (UPF0748 family)
LFRLKLIFISLTLINIIPFIISSNPKREFRGAWIATIKNIDWPSSPGLPVEVQKIEMNELFNSLHQAGINAVLFQVRTESDALYQSQIEPWSYWLTGDQAKPPDPLYDPLQYAIQLARQRGMEFHAWFNPFRVKADTAGYVPDSTHISFRFPEWIIQTGKYKFLNPGIPEVREYVKKVIMDIVKRYEIDGIHFDDYFYPYSGVTNQDVEAYKIHSKDFQNIEDWRRDNVNIFVRDIYNSIKQIKPNVKFGISPFGIWKDGIPPGITGFSAYHQIYCDAVYWLQEKIVDYIAPQIYWRIGGNQDYYNLSNWWIQQSNKRHVYIGHALYKMDRKNDVWGSKDITNQIELNQLNQEIEGSIFFRASDIKNNLNGITDSLQQKYYKTPALIPQMGWIDSTSPPLFPFNLRALPSDNGTFLIWNNPDFKKAEDKVKYNVVYRFVADSMIDIGNGETVSAVLPASQSFFVDTTGIPGFGYTYLVIALDRLHNESEISNTATAKYSQLEIYSEFANENRLFDLDSVIIKNRTRIRFSLAEKEIVNLSLFNHNGEKIFNLLNEELKPGIYGVLLDYDKLHVGKYYYKFTTPSLSEMKSFFKSSIKRKNDF